MCLTNLIDIWVVDLGSEENLRRNHWVLIWQEKFSVKHASIIWSVSWSSDFDMEMSEIVLIRLSVNSDN